MKNITYGLLITLSVIKFNALGQNCSHCAIAIIAAAQDEFASKTYVKYDEALNTLFSYDYNYWLNYQKGNNTSLNGAYALFSASYGSRSAESQQKFELMKINYQKNHTISLEEKQYISSKVASKTAYDAWTTCILNCSKGGVILDKEGNANNEFIVNLKWISRPGDGSSARTHVTNVVCTNCDFEEGDLRNGAELVPWNSLLRKVKRKIDNQDVTITVSTTSFPAQSIIIKGDPPPHQEIIAPKVSKKVYYEIVFNDINGNGRFDNMTLNGNNLSPISYARNDRKPLTSAILNNGENKLDAYIVGGHAQINAEIKIVKYFTEASVVRSRIIRDLAISGTWNCDLRYLKECNAHIQPTGQAVEQNASGPTLEFNIDEDEEIVDSKDEL